MQVLPAPAVRDELARQPVEQLRMRRAAAAKAKVARRADQAAAKMVIPNAVHHHAASQRMRRIAQPFGQRQPPLGLGRGGAMATG